MSKTKGHWPKGKRRNELDVTRMIRGLCAEFSLAELARRCGVSPRQVGKWRDGHQFATREQIEKLIDSIFRQNVGSIPIYSPDMAIDGNTRVAGVGQYSIESARGRKSLCSD